VDVSESTLQNIIFPPFKAADAGENFMNSFNELNRFLQLGVLIYKENFEEDWKFDGFVVSDWGSMK
jgi:beta-glucosidase